MRSSSASYTGKPTKGDIDRKPWRYLGYHSFANFVASDHDFFVLRRFGSLNARGLLGLQDQLSQIEEQLEALEDHLRSKDGPNVRNGSFREETQDERAQLVKLAQHVLHEYSQLRSIGYILFPQRLNMPMHRRARSAAFSAASTATSPQTTCQQSPKLVLQ